MQITRRNFLHSIGAAGALAVSGGLVPSAFAQQTSREHLFPIPPEAYADGLFSVSAKQFRALIGQSFSVASEACDSALLVLTEVNTHERLENALQGYYGDSFSLIFEVRGKRSIPQSTYEITGPGISTLSILLVPTSRRLREYEAVINRLTR